MHLMCFSQNYAGQFFQVYLGDIRNVYVTWKLFVCVLALCFSQSFFETHSYLKQNGQKRRVNLGNAYGLLSIGTNEIWYIPLSCLKNCISFGIWGQTINCGVIVKWKFLYSTSWSMCTQHNAVLSRDTWFMEHCRFKSGICLCSANKQTVYLNYPVLFRQVAVFAVSPTKAYLYCVF